MSSSNGYNSNSLLALEQTLYGHKHPSQRSEGFAAEEPETPDLSQDSLEPPPAHPIQAQAFDWDEAIALDYEGGEAQAFDWDEAISLDYEQAEPPTAQSFDWLPTDDSSQSLGADNDIQTFTVEAFAVEEEPSSPEPPSVQQRDAVPKENYAAQTAYTGESHGLEAEPEALKSVEPPTQSHKLKAEPEALKSVEPPTQSHKLKAEPEPPKSVEPPTQSHKLEAEPEPPKSVEPPIQSSQSYSWEDAPDTEETPPILDRQASTSQAYAASEAVPVHATIAPPPSPPQTSAVAFDFDDLESSLSAVPDTSDAEAFAADVAAILRGEKTYEPAAAPQPTPPPSQAKSTPQAPSLPQSQAQALPPKPPSAHDVFDQMGRSMAHATAFDLGTFSLEQTFDEFDRFLDERESTSADADNNKASAPLETVKQEKAEIDPMGRSMSEDLAFDPETISWEQEFDEFDRLLDTEDQQLSPANETTSDGHAVQFDQPDWVASLNKIRLNNPKSWEAACLTMGIQQTDPIINGSKTWLSINRALQNYFTTKNRQNVDQAIRDVLEKHKVQKMSNKHEQLLAWLSDQLDQNTQRIGYELECADIEVTGLTSEYDSYGKEVMKTTEVDPITNLPLVKVVLEENQRGKTKIEIVTAPQSYSNLKNLKTFINNLADSVASLSTIDNQRTDVQKWSATAPKWRETEWIVTIPEQITNVKFRKLPRGGRLIQTNVDLYLDQFFTKPDLIKQMMMGRDREHFYGVAINCVQQWRSENLIQGDENSKLQNKDSRYHIAGLMTYALYVAMTEYYFTPTNKPVPTEAKERTQPLVKVGVDDLARVGLTRQEREDFLLKITTEVDKASSAGWTRLQQALPLRRQMVNKIKEHLRGWFLTEKPRYKAPTDRASSVTTPASGAGGVLSLYPNEQGGNTYDTFMDGKIRTLGNSLLWKVEKDKTATKTQKPIEPRVVGGRTMVVAEVRKNETPFNKNYYHLI